MKRLNRKLERDALGAYLANHAKATRSVAGRGVLFELAGHGRVTIDVSYDLRIIRGTKAECISRGANPDCLKIFKITEATGRKVEVR